MIFASKMSALDHCVTRIFTMLSDIEGWTIRGCSLIIHSFILYSPTNCEQTWTWTKRMRILLNLNVNELAFNFS